MSKHLFLSLIFFLCWSLLFSQSSTILNEGEPKSILVNTLEYPENSFNKQVINILAQSNGGNTSDVKLEYTTKEYHLITQRGTKIYLSASIGNIILQGDHIYKKFSINQLLMPSLVNFNYHWVDANGTEINSDKIMGEFLKSGADVINLTKAENSKALNSKFYLSDVAFVFSKNDLKKLDTYVEAVDNYYDADAKLNMVNQELDKIRMDTLELLDEFYNTTLNNIKYFNQLKSQRLNSKLSLAANDPIGLRSKIGKTEVRNRELKSNLEYVQKNMHETYYKKGLDWLNWKNEEKASYYFHKSINEKNIYAPPFYELANLDYKHGNLQSVLDTCKIIINTKKPDNDIRYSTLNLAEQVILAYLDTTIALVKDNHFEAALSKLNYCKGYVNKVEGMRKFPEFNDIESKIYTGYYKTLAETAQNDIDNNSLKTAHKGIDSLINFRLAYKQLYIAPDEEEVLLNNLYTAWLIKGNSMLNSDMIDSSLYCLTHAKIICSKHDFVNCDESLVVLLNKAYNESYKNLLHNAELAIEDELADSALSLIKLAKQNQIAYNLTPLAKLDTLYIQAIQIKYNGLIKEGNYSLNGGDGRQALAFYKEAIDISQNTKIQVDSTLMPKAKDAATAYILMICKNSETYIKTLQIEQAQAGLVKSRMLEQEFELYDRVEVDQAIEQLATLLNQGRCNLIQHDYNVQIGATKKFIDRKDFTNAQNSISKAENLAKQSADCSIDKTELHSISKEIFHISVYTKRLIELNQNIDKGKFNQSIHEYIALSSYYTDSVKNNYDIQHKELFDFAFENKNSDFVNNAAQFYIEQSESEKALELLNELYRRDYISSWSKESQIKLGTYYANRDFEEDSEIDPKLKVSHYTNDLPWFKYLKKAYLKQWNGLL